MLPRRVRYGTVVAIALLAQQHPPERLNRFRDRARELAPQLGMQERFAFLDDLVGAALGSRPAPEAGALLRARAESRATGALPAWP